MPSNIDIAILAALMLFGLVVFIRRRPPSAIMICGFAGVGMFGPSLWGWGSKGVEQWSGLPPSIQLDGSSVDLGRRILLLAAISCLLPSLISLRQANGDRGGGGSPKPAGRSGLSDVNQARDTRKAISVFLNRVSYRSAVLLNIGVMLLWIAGEGSNLWLRAHYLQTSGSTILLRFSTALTVPLVLGTAVLLGRGRGWDPWAKGSVLTLFIWVVLFLSVTTRACLIAVAALGVAYAGHLRLRRRSFWAVAAGVISGIGALGLAIPVHNGRTQVTGLAPTIREVASGRAIGWFGPSALASSIQGLAASFGTSFPVVAMSAEQPLQPATVLALASPVPRGVLGGAASYSLVAASDTLTPYSWVPKSALAEVYGAFGSLGVLAVGATIATACDYIWRQARSAKSKRGLSALEALPYGLAMFVTLAALQYGTRESARLVSLLGVVALYARVRRRRTQLIRSRPISPSANRLQVP